jgi:tetratricopeptide (TPR) repeat protein
VAAAAGPGRPVVFVGLDGADWQLLDRYLQEGAMPHLAALVREGSGGVLETLHPPLSPLLWTTMMTGISPLDHGILDFTRFNPRTGQKEPITSDERREPAVWNAATYAGRRVAVLGLWATYPAEPVNGLMVSDRLFGFLFQEESPPPGVVYPPAQEAWARDALKRAEGETGLKELQAYLPWLDEAEYGRRRGAADPYAHPVSALRRILVETRVYHQLATEWIAREKPELAVVYLQGTDSIGHVFAPFAPPRQASVTAEDYERYKDVPELYFRHVDRLLGEYARLAAAAGGVLVLASDHGFAWAEGRPERLSSFAQATAAKWHRKEGIYLLWGAGIMAAPGHAGRGRVDQVASTLLALLGLPTAPYMAGPPLPGAPAARSERVDYRAHYKPSSLALAAPSAGAGEEALAKLRALGYVGAGEATSAPAGARGSTQTAGSFNNRGLLLKDQGRPEDAISAFEKALEMDPALASALWNLSDLLFEKERDPDRSDELLVRAFASGLPEGTRFLVGRAIGYQRAGRIDRSRALLAAAAAARPDEPEVWLFSGRYRIEAGDCRGALDSFRRAVSLAPRNAAAHASEGLARLCLGDRAGARACLRRSLELDPDQPGVKEQLGNL